MKRITLTQKCKNLEALNKTMFDDIENLRKENVQIQHKLNGQTQIAETAKKLHETLLMQYNLRMDSIINLAKQRF